MAKTGFLMTWLTCILKFECGFTAVTCTKQNADGMANSVDPDQTAPSVRSRSTTLFAIQEQTDLGLYCLPLPVSLKTIEVGT